MAIKISSHLSFLSLLNNKDKSINILILQINIVPLHCKTNNNKRINSYE